MSRGIAAYLKGAKSLAWLSLCALLLATVSVSESSAVAGSTSGTVTKCGHYAYCTGVPGGPNLRLSFNGTGVHVSGKDWPASRQVDISFWQRLGFVGVKTSRRAALTGLILDGNQGNFRFSLPREGFCSYWALLTARSGQYKLQLPRPSGVFCHERPSPIPPIETFRVHAGHYVRAIYARSFVRQRYSLTLASGWPAGPRLGREKALSIARKTAKASTSAPVWAKRGTTGVGLAGLGTGVWEVWVGGVQVPGYGLGHEVVLIVLSTQNGSPPKLGTVLATWFAP